MGMIILHSFACCFSLLLVVAAACAQPSRMQKVLFGGTTFFFINIVGYLCELLSTSREMMQISVKLQYVGMAVALIFFLLFFDIYNTRVPKNFMKVFKVCYCINNAAILLIVLFFDKYTLYYESVEPVITADGHYLWSYTVGPCYYWWFATVYILTFLLLVIVVMSAWDHRGEAKGEYFLLIAVILIPIAVILLKLTGVFGYYDAFPIAMTIADIILIFDLYAYNVFDAVSVAKERVLEELNEGIFVIDAKGHIIYNNKEADLVFPDIDEDDTKKHQEIVNFLQWHTDGFWKNDHYYKWDVTNIVDQNERFGGSLYRILDMTTDYNHTRALVELREEAERANEAKSSFLANMSHEIRTPINAVLGMNEMILRECDADNIREYAFNIQNAGKSLLSIINDVLDLSKIESGKMELSEADYDVCTLIGDVENMISIRAEEKNLKLIMDIDPSIPSRLHGDEVRIKQCLVNVLTNAVKYTEHGSITCKIAANSEDEETVELWASVTDTGIGIREEDLHKLFDSFSRLDLNRNRTVEGTGLGLNITKQLVEMMGGSLTVDSVYGSGSTFTIVLPQKIVSPEPMGDYRESIRKLAKQTAQKKQSFRAPSAKILAVDDNKVNLAVVKGFMKKLAVQYDSALSGAECLKKAAETHYDIIFLDHMMPEMDGIETLQHLKETDEYKQNPPAVIALTANAVSGAKEEYLAAGFADYLAKPIDSAQLENMIRKYLPSEYIEDVE